MKKQFPLIEFEKPTTKLKEINAIDTCLEKRNKNNLKKDLDDTPSAGRSLYLRKN